MSSKVLVGSKSFMLALEKSSSLAKNSLFVQAMTFEGDDAGEQLIDLMIKSPAKDKRLLIDSFSKVVISDNFVFGPKFLKDAAFRNEIRETKRLIQKAKEAGVKVRYTNPVGFLMSKYPLRNHKKMMIVDGEISYLGGINFSDHNFSWYDMMIEIQDDLISNSLKLDFLATWEGKNQSKKIHKENGSLYFFNGIKSKELYEDFFQNINDAENEVVVISPYVSEPLLSRLKIVSNRGVSVKIISPSENNKGLFQDYLLSENRQGYFELLHYPGMFHLKAILIDGRKLIFGSSNYDLVSYHFEQEVVVVSEYKDLIDKFINEVFMPMKSASKQNRKVRKTSVKARLVMNLLKGFCFIASHGVIVPKS